MKQVDATKPHASNWSIVWLPLSAASILAVDCFRNEETFCRFFFGLLILLSTYGTLLFISSFSRFKSRSDLAKPISYAVMLIAGAWLAMRLAYGGVTISIAYFDGFLLGGLSGSLTFRKYRQSNIEGQS